MIRQPKPKPCCQSARTWLANRNGRKSLAVFTGGTSRAFSAYVHLVDVWIHSRSKESICALRATVAMLQPSEWKLAAEVIAHVGDWGHIEELWEKIKPRGAPYFAYYAASDRVVGIDDATMPSTPDLLDSKGSGEV